MIDGLWLSFALGPSRSRRRQQRPGAGQGLSPPAARGLSLWRLARVRLRHRRRRLGRLRARQPAERRPGLRVLLLEAGPARSRLEDPHAGGADLQSDERPAELVLHDRAAAPYGRAQALLAARPRARRLVLAQRHGLYPRPRAATTTAGSRRVPPAGPMPRCCPTSGAPRPFPAAAMPIAATAARCTSPAATTANPLFDAWIAAGERGGLPARPTT